MAATKFPWRTVLNYYTSIVLGQPSTPDSWRTGDRLTEFSSKSPLMDVQKDSLTLWAPPLPHTGASTASGDPSYFPGGRWTLYLLQFYSSFPKDYHYGGKMFFLLNKNLLSILYPTETSPPLSPESNRGEIVSLDKWQWEGWVEDFADLGKAWSQGCSTSPVWAILGIGWKGSQKVIEAIALTEENLMVPLG